jgi:4-amino-4-deoxy-L-arabinose transferase-like glycosyltransferase
MTSNRPDPSAQTRSVLQIADFLPVLLIALLFRALVLASGAVSFHSDEAIVGLMARHIVQGRAIPTFFYGQSYMGSLDPLLVSIAFRLFGESVLSIRLVQSALYLGIVATTMLLALRLSGSRRIADLAGLLLALPPVVMTLYTTISLGGYGEALLMGNMILLIGCDLVQPDIRRSGWRWLALGALAGLGWWTNSLIVAYLLPITLFLVHDLLANQRFIPWTMIGGAAITFVIFSAPWWLYNLNHDWESVRFLVGGFQSGAPQVSIGDKVVGLFFLGLPAIFGLRFSWASSPWPGAWTVPIAVIYVVILALAARSGRLRLLWVMVVGFVLIFVLSNFGVDATGRYLLPLVVPLAILMAAQVDALWQKRIVAIAMISVLIGTNLLGTVIAMRTVPPGLTPQFDPATDFPNDHDQAVIDFLLQHGGQRGYATYWVTYRLAFLSQEKVILAPLLPYKASLDYTASDRFPAYTADVETADYPVLVMANLPKLDQAIVQQLDSRGIAYRRQAIGPYTVFYDLSHRVTPAELGLQSLHD